MQFTFRFSDACYHVKCSLYLLKIMLTSFIFNFIMSFLILLDLSMSEATKSTNIHPDREYTKGYRANVD